MLFPRGGNEGQAMTIRNLNFLFRPRSVAVVGATSRGGSVASAVMRNLLEGGFRGPVYPVHPTHRAVHGVHVYRDLARLPQTPDLVVVCTPAEEVPSVIDEVAGRGTKAAVVVASGLAGVREPDGRTLQQRMLDAARRHLVRILGPNSLGIAVPGIGLNATFASAAAPAGNLALVSQSGVLTSAILEHAGARSVGFSAVVSLGDGADVDAADAIDFLGTDLGTRAIVLYLESAGTARKFLSAARAAARNKPLVVLKGGRTEEGARAAALHTGAPMGDDAVFDAALRRCGAVRAESIEDMLLAVQSVTRIKPGRSDRVAIMTNGGGPGVIATDALVVGGGELASLSATTVDKLDELLPPWWSRSNPMDVSGDAPPARYAAALDALLGDVEVDAILFLHGPTAVTAPKAVAEACAPVIRGGGKNVFACWMGSAATAAAARIFSAAGVPIFDTPEAAARALLATRRYRTSQALLLEAPPSLPREFPHDDAAVRALIGEALRSGRDRLDEPAAMRLLAAYGIPVADSFVAPGVDEAIRHAQQLGFPVALKVISPDIVHRAEVGGVMLNLESADEVRRAAADIEKRLHSLRPGARLEGFLVQRMIRPRGSVALRSGGHELRVCVRQDPVFGPVVVFGPGGRGADQTADWAIGLPPLNMALAHEVIARTRVYRVLAAPAETGGVDVAALQRILMEVAQLVVDHAEISEIVIDPLVANEHTVVAFRARIGLSATSASAHERLAIRPYPKELEERIDAGDREVILRPIRPEDAPAYARFLSQTDHRDLRHRFFGETRTLTPATLARFTQIDYDREMSFVAATLTGVAGQEILAELRLVTEPENQYAEVAILVRSDAQRKGLGRALLRKAVDYGRRRGTKELIGFVMPANRPMLALAESTGIETHRASEDGTIVLRWDLRPERSVPAAQLF
jgi:acetyltransferase